MTIVYITGLLGVGKTTVLQVIARSGYEVVDTDYGGYVIETASARLLHEPKMRALLQDVAGHLFISGCYENQRDFYDAFHIVVLLTAELETMLHRIE